MYLHENESRRKQTGKTFGDLGTKLLSLKDEGFSLQLEHLHAFANRYTQLKRMTPEGNLKELGYELPHVSTPGGNYVSVNIRGNIAYIAIQFPILNGVYEYQGRLGNEITTEEGCRAMEICALNVLAQINRKIGFEKVLGLNHIDAYFQSGEN